MAKILFLTYNYPPQRSPRAVQISHWVQSLQPYFSVTVVTSAPPVLADASLLSFTPMNNVVYGEKSFLTRIIERARGDRIKRAALPDSFYPWHWDGVRKIEEILQHTWVDGILTMGQPMSTHVAGIKLKKRYPHLVWVAHCSDPWVDNPFTQYNPWTRWWNQHYQNAVFAQADRLVFTAQETADLVDPALQYKVRVIPHAFREELYPSLHSTTASRPLILRHVGHFYGPRQPSFLFQALQRLSPAQRAQIRLELVGTPDLANLPSSLQGLVVPRPAVSYLDSLALMVTADLLIILDAPARISPFLPSKLVDYIGANRPIFGITPPGPSRRLLEEIGFAVVHPQDPESIALQLSRVLVQLHSSTPSVYTSPILSSIRQRYDLEVIGIQIRNLLEEVLKEK